MKTKLALAAGLIAAATSAQATLIAWDNFDVATGAAGGATAGAGFTTNWTADGAFSVASGSLTYSDPLYANFGASGNMIQATGSWSEMRADFAAQTGRVWFSYLFQPTSIVGFHQAGIQPTSGEAFKVGMKNVGGTDGVPFSEHNNGGADGTLFNNVEFVAGDVYLMVGTYSTDGVAPSALYVNPVLGGALPGLGYEEAVFSGTNWGASNIERFRMYAIDANWLVDNLRVGTTFESVTTEVIPEPSTYAAIAGALALGAVALRRRRK